ncbi:unnamed protein product [Moneuplotes crassus]|uniref:Uncharacterized protein n=2 Tax=Euplotes crassus TaxID=5936 RepID=A0AAD1XQV2_EUPCR|nr:unnamed protein product [Moneuplotes crassus]
MSKSILLSEAKENSRKLKEKKNLNLKWNKMAGLLPPSGYGLLHIQGVGKIKINEAEGELTTPSDLKVIDDVWYKLTLHFWSKADHQFTMERVDELSEILSEKVEDLSSYYEMCSKMIDWLRSKANFAGEIVCNHYKISKEKYCQLRDDSQDSNISKSFMVRPTTVQNFTIPPQYKSLSKDLSKIQTEEDIKRIVDELYNEASCLVTSYDPNKIVEEHKLEMLYQMLLKDLSLIKYSLDFNDIKHKILKMKLPLSEFSHCAVRRAPFEVTLL